MMATRRLFVAVLLASAAAAFGSVPAEAQPVEAAQHRSGIITSNDYPTSALRAQAEGTSILRHLVGTDGRVLRCEVIGSSGNYALDSTACSLIQRRFRYRPARNGAGVPVEQWRIHRQVWSLPDAGRAVSGPKPASD
jgi:protein TonB